ncbi:4-hydroxy-tetrahydrodipicolinate synthase [Clostridium carboxidivorans P7]|uniref:4-hydroxy-tetrahydrodipicolinate synthase n=1 Tax=Clostridium carboxidivorans P7 TaxID=536227 RepID=C6PQF9_9CLOT|nr:4-hydroxy-tetrahydrodipicolinate synthase [Clostridium carboxidivorans]AKN30447.1 4-hydroxy-tetrahydrodipicolinate synthase [Clostridium carboxidivorans P7]EET88481.1 dihydrodipicolinate synthase [Clostridium carboxidivorans P7]EFG86188.1 dihydrodipicolinate synthase [Clostridium carboxidivorans P7]
MCLFEGSGVAIVTPYTESGIDYEKLGELIDWQIENKTDAIIICGTTGEAATMTDAERKETIEFAVKRVNKRIPVIAGTGSNNTAYSIELSKYAEKVGVDGVLLVTPYYNKSTQKGVIEHFKAIVGSIKVPAILYNVPGRTGMSLKAETVYELSKVENIVAIKEASGDIVLAADIARLCGEDFSIYSGNDDMVVPILSLGGKGVISVVANILPEDTHNMVMEYLNGNVKEARKLQLKMNGVIHALFIETNPIPVKTAMNVMGMNVGKLRMPLTTMEDKNKKVLIDNMEEYGIEVKEK